MVKVFGNKWHVFGGGSDDAVSDEASNLSKLVHDSPLILELIQQIKDTATFFTSCDTQGRSKRKLSILQRD